MTVLIDTTSGTTAEFSLEQFLSAYNDSENINRTAGTIMIDGTTYSLVTFQIKKDGVAGSGSSGSGGWSNIRTTSTSGQEDYTNSLLTGKTIQLVVVDRAVQVEGDDFEFSVDTVHFLNGPLDENLSIVIYYS
jgi:hypothetical protein